MKKIFSIILIMFMVLAFIAPAAMASVLIELNGTTKDHATKINLTGAETLTFVGKKVTIPIVDSTMIAAGAANGGATSMASNTTAVPVTFAYINMAIAADANFLAKTLANGKKGQILTLRISTQEASNTLTVTPATAYQFTSLSFNAIDDIATLLYIDDTDGWAVISTTSVAIIP